jgi:hypothetical protein
VKTEKVRRPLPEVSRDAKRRGAILLEVLAGVRTPMQAAESLGLSLPGFYQLEDRAMNHFLAGCELRPRGRQPNGESKQQALAREIDRLKKELRRYQTLVRLTQRTVGVAPPPPPANAAGRRRRKRPMVRALRRADRLNEESQGEAGTARPDSNTE